MRLSFTPLAEQDLESIGDYIATHNPARALSFIQQLRQQCLRLTTSPGAYRARPELGDNLHSCVSGNYIIFFSIVKDDVLIIRILHHARDIAPLFSSQHKAR